MSFGPEWLVVVAVLVLFFGVKKIPELAHAIGRSVHELKRGAHDEEPKREG